MAAADRRRHEHNQMRNVPGGLPPLHQHHTNSPAESAPNTTPNSIQPHANVVRPGLDRAQNFPTPPTSAPNVISNMGTPDGNFQWGHQPGLAGVQSSNPLPIDSGLTNQRPMPSTSTSNPPGTSIPNMQYQQANQSYDSSRQIYSSQANAYSQTTSENPNGRYQSTNPYLKADISSHASNSYIKGDMGPPSSHGARSGPDAQDKDPNILIHSQNQAQPNHDEERDHENDSEYTHGNSSNFDSTRAPYNYSNSGSVTALPNDHSQLTTEHSGASIHPASGRATPRTASAPQPYYSHSTSYNSMPRAQAPSSNLYSVISSKRGPPNNNSGDIYSSSQDCSSTTSGYSTVQQPLMSRVGTCNKRSRDDDDKPNSPVSNGESAKRRNTGSTIGSKSIDISGESRPRPPILQRRC